MFYKWLAARENHALEGRVRAMACHEHLCVGAYGAVLWLKAHPDGPQLSSSEKIAKVLLCVCVCARISPG